MQSKYPSPCLKCSKAATCAGHIGNAHYRRWCPEWEIWFRWWWKQFRTALKSAPRTMDIMPADPDKLQYSHPDQVRRYLQTGPCASCSAESICDSPLQGIFAVVRCQDGDYKKEGGVVNQKDMERLQELRSKDTLTDKEWRQLEYLENKLESNARVEQFRKNQQEPYSSKYSRAVNLAWEFYKNPEINGQCYVAVGGLDSITLYLFLRSIGIDVPAVSVSSLEDKSIQKVHKALGVIPLKSATDDAGRPYSKIKVIREFGWPVLSKEIAGKISHIQHPTEDNATVRHAIITGETGAQGGWREGSRMQLPKTWLKLFGGADPEGKELGYDEADFFVSDKCCYYLKEKPCDDYHLETGRWPYMGLMASEGGRRQKALAVNGCNYISPTTKRSCPFATFLRDDILRLVLEMDAWYQENYHLFPGPKLDTIVPAIYGKIITDDKGKLQTTDAQRTGCSMCGFGIHREERPHRFDLLWERNPKEWGMWMTHVDQDKDGNWYGWGHVLDYIGVKWRKPWIWVEAKRQAEAVEQLTMEGML